MTILLALTALSIGFYLGGLIIFRFLYPFTQLSLYMENLPMFVLKKYGIFFYPVIVYVIISPERRRKIIVEMSENTPR